MGCLSNYHTGVPRREQNYCGSCPPRDQCPDFVLKQHDTRPDFRVQVEDCDGALELKDHLLILEANMWTNARLKHNICPTDITLRLADNIGFEQVLENDIIMMERARNPEFMLVTGFDEEKHEIFVQRAYKSAAFSWKKGAFMKIFRILNGPAQIELVYREREEEHRRTRKKFDVQPICERENSGLATLPHHHHEEERELRDEDLDETALVYKWQTNDTCMAGCYMLEFKLLKMENNTIVVPEHHHHHHHDMMEGLAFHHHISHISHCHVSHVSCSVPSIPSIPSSSLDVCSIGSGVEWVRRFPTTKEGFLIHIVPSPTLEVI